MSPALVAGYIDRYNELVKRLLGVKGEPLEGVAPELLVDLTLEQLPSNAYEWYFLLGTTRYSTGRFPSAVPAAGLFSESELRNPVASSTLIVLEGIWLDVAFCGVSGYNLGIDQVAATSAIQRGTSLDTRESKKSSAEGRTAAGLVAIGVTDANASDSQVVSAVTEENPLFPISVGLVLSPGHSVQVAARNAATATSAIFVFRERPVQPSELKAS